MSYQSAINHGTLANPGSTPTGSISVGPIVPRFANSFAIVACPYFSTLTPYAGWINPVGQATILTQQFAGQPSITNTASMTCLDNVNDEWAAVMVVYETDGTPVALSGGSSSYSAFHYPSADPFTITVNQNDAVIVMAGSGTSIASGQNGGDYGLTVTDSDNNQYTLVKAVSNAPHDNVVYIFTAFKVKANAALVVTVTGGNGSPSVGPGGVSILSVSHLVDTPAAPTVTSVVPSSGTSLGGTSVTITGTAFVATPTVTFDGLAATGVVWVDSSHLTAVTPAHVAGAVNVVVTNPDTQSGTLVNGYTYTKPALQVTPLSLSFVGAVGGPNPANQSVSVTKLGLDTLNYTAVASASWVSVSPASGAAPDTLTIAVNYLGLAVGVYTGSVTVTGANALSSPQTVLVTFTVSVGTFTATLQSLTGVVKGGTILFDLVGFGSAQPYWTDGVGKHFAQTHIKADSGITGLINIPLVGNDLIVPAGTSYQVTVLSPDLGFVSQGRFKFTGLLFNFNTATPVQPL
jgi:hypothetical protein